MERVKERRWIWIDRWRQKLERRGGREEAFRKIGTFRAYIYWGNRACKTRTGKIRITGFVFIKKFENSRCAKNLNKMLSPGFPPWWSQTHKTKTRTLTNTWPDTALGKKNSGGRRKERRRKVFRSCSCSCLGTIFRTCVSPTFLALDAIPMLSPVGPPTWWYIFV